jgi:hypothetical protein
MSRRFKAPTCLRTPNEDCRSRPISRILNASSYHGTKRCWMRRGPRVPAGNDCSTTLSRTSLPNGRPKRAFWRGRSGAIPRVAASCRRTFTNASRRGRRQSECKLAFPGSFINSGFGRNDGARDGLRHGQPELPISRPLHFMEIFRPGIAGQIPCGCQSTPKSKPEPCNSNHGWTPINTDSQRGSGFDEAVLAPPFGFRKTDQNEWSFISVHLCPSVVKDFFY